tara:strand:- start:7658 stop:9670 length:2013 start_codon:yes stop_codon:yes gene_type:complete
LYQEGLDMKVRIPQNNFERGEISPSMRMRTDLNTYVQGAEEVRNLFLLAEGGVKRRAGTEWLHTFTGTPNTANRVEIRLEPFLFSDDERYIMAFYNAGLKVFRINASTGVVSLVATITADSASASLPWTTARLERMTFTQNADVMFIAHPDFMIRKITRTSVTAFSVTTFAFDETVADDQTYQPYFSFQASGVTLTPQATSGTGKTMTTSADYWNSSHVGTIIRYAGNEVLITGYTSATVVTGTVRKTLSATTASTNWDEASIGAYRGYPSAITFHEDRLWFAGTTNQPDAIWASTTSEYFNYDVGSAGDSDSIQITINVGEFNAIRHLVANRDLQVFTSTSELYIPSFADKALTPTNTQIRRQTPYGASYTRPLPFDGATLYVQKTGTSVREFLFSDKESAYVSTPISLISSHLINNPVHMASVKGAFDRPEQYAFVVNADGSLAVFHSIRNEEKAGWAKWTTTGNYHSVCAIDDRVFCVVSRDLGSGTNTYSLEEFKTSLRLDCSDSFTATSSNNGIFSTNTIYTNNAVLSVIEGDNYIGSFTQASNQINVSSVKSINTAEIGLSFTASLKSLPIDAQVTGGPLTGEPRAITRVNLDLLSTLSVSVNAQPLLIQGVTDTVTSSQMAFNSFTGKKEFRLLGYSRDPRVEITQTAPLDLQINGMIVEVAF